MPKRCLHIRDSVIPDLSVKLLNLCLSTNENEILIPQTQRENCDLNFQADITLKEIITQKINNESKGLPLALRKKKLYEKIILESKKEKKENDFEDIFTLEVVPITMRKHLLCRQCRAG